MGMDGWWMDSTEPDHFDWKPEDFDTKTYLGSFRKVRNAYPLLTVGGVYDNQRAVTSDKRVFILTRSVFAGQQRYGPMYGREISVLLGNHCAIRFRQA